MENKIYLYSDVIKIFFDKEEIKEEYKLELENCPVCNSKEVDIIFKHYNFYYNRCRRCSFVFTNPRLNDVGSHIWYNSDFYNAAVESEYYQVKNGDRFFASLNIEMFENVIKMVNKIDLGKDNSILEIGCGGGAFLEYISEKMNIGYLLGIDINEKAIDFAKNYRHLNVHKINANELKTDSKFDLLISMESIEHANDLSKFMSAIKHNLKNGGHVLITTPYNDRLATFLGGIWGDHYMAPNHINFFNMKSMRNLLERYHLDILDFRIIKTPYRLGLVKDRILNKRDWATSNPPKMVEHSINIPKNKTNNAYYVKQIVNSEGSVLDLENKSVLMNRFKSSYNNLMKTLNIQWKTHMIILAKEK